MKRTIEIADFELPRGEVAIGQLMAMPQAGWEHLRMQINRRRQEAPTRPLARCRLCEGAVYIRSQFIDRKHVPLFAHYADASEDCPWHHGKNLKPDNARAAQYQGHQESARHRRLCQMIGEVLELDERCKKLTVETYRRPSIERRGRYPDVYAELDGLGKFAIEVQLAKPFATEIIARQLHYDAEGVSLIWVFAELPAELPQGFRDVISMHRGNAFVFDDAALAMSMKRETLVLSTHLAVGEETFSEPKPAALDELNLTLGRAIFLSDVRSDALRKQCEAARSIWRIALRKAPPKASRAPYREGVYEEAWNDLLSRVPDIGSWAIHSHHEEAYRGDRRFSEIAAILFSIARTAATGSDSLYVTRYRDKGALIAMLNAKLSAEHIMPFADLIRQMVAGTAASDRLEVASLGRAFAAAQDSADQIGPAHPVWKAAKLMFPEAYDGMLRAELEDLGNLPAWANANGDG